MLSFRRKSFLTFVACGIVLILLKMSDCTNDQVLPTSANGSTGVPGTSGATNSTLGFGAIYALTQDDSTWRVQGLLGAAELVGLEITIPIQPIPTDEDVMAYWKLTTLGGESWEHNSVRAILNYVTLLEEFLASGAETALFVEDDVDFGLDIKDQMRTLSNAVTESFSVATLDSLSLQHHHSNSNTANEENLLYPYGLTSAWDLFWLGHLGMELTHESSSVPYKDVHALPWSRLTSQFNNYYTSAWQAEGEQKLAFNVAPLATYAFALRREHVTEVIKTLKEENFTSADLALHVRCKGGRSRCWAVAPEVFHHMRIDGQSAITLGWSEGDGQVEEGARRDEGLDWWLGQHKYTYNVEWSARCNAGQTGQLVDGKWQCLPGTGDDIVRSSRLCLDWQKKGLVVFAQSLRHFNCSDSSES